MGFNSYDLSLYNYLVYKHKIALTYEKEFLGLTDELTKLACSDEAALDENAPQKQK